MKTHIILLFGLLLAFAGQVFAQELSKEERKEWVKRAKEYKRNPERLKTLVEEWEVYKDQALQVEDEINAAEARYRGEREKALRLEDELNRVNNQLQVAEENVRILTMEIERLKKERTTGPEPEPTDPATTAGVVYRVQVGAFTKGRVPVEYRERPDAIIEEDGNVQKVLIGSYRSLDEAKMIARQMNDRGAPGAFVVAYRDGVRISIQEAMQNN